MLVFATLLSVKYRLLGSEAKQTNYKRAHFGALGFNLATTASLFFLRYYAVFSGSPEGILTCGLTVEKPGRKVSRHKSNNVKVEINYKNLFQKSNLLFCRK